MRLIDADALKKEIRENDPFGGMNYEWYIDHAPPIVPAPRWVRVEEPPKESGRFLIGCFFDDGSFGWEAAEYAGTEWENDHGCYCGPDYWMPIEPPKEDA